MNINCQIFCRRHESEKRIGFVFGGGRLWPGSSLFMQGFAFLVEHLFVFVIAFVFVFVIALVFVFVTLEEVWSGTPALNTLKVL